jgi:hypothetical protein
MGAPAALMVAGVAALAALGSDSSDGAEARATPALAAARALAASSGRVLNLRSPALTLARARRFADRRRRTIPLPRGGNFNGIQWRNAPRPLTPGTVEQILEYNARCQWLRAEAGQREPEAAQVARLADRWPALRELPPASELAGLLASCYASHRREVEHARSLALTPST